MNFSLSLPKIIGVLQLAKEMRTQKEAATREGKEVRYPDTYVFDVHSYYLQVENEKVLAEAALSVLKVRNEQVS